MSNLTQVFLHPEISSFQFSLNLAHHQPRIRENFHCLSTHFLNHGHPYQQSFVLSFIVCGREAQSQGFLNCDPLWGYHH